MSETVPFPAQNSENTGENGAFYRSLAREFIAEPFPPDSLRPLRREIRKALRTLRRMVRRSSDKPEEAGFREWLEDNYHLLSREGISLLNDLRYAEMQPCDGKWPATCAMFFKLAHKIDLPDSDGLEELITVLQRVRPLTVFELEQLPICLRAALLLTAADACSQSGIEAKRLIAAAVTGLHQTVGIDFAGLTERHSIVEHILQEDPAGIYPRMDEKSRIDYRRRTAVAAILTERSEVSTAAAIVEEAQKGKTVRERHVGTPLTAYGDGFKRRKRGRILLLCTAILPALVSVALAALVGMPLLTILLYLPVYEFLRPFVELIGFQGVTPKRLPRLELDGVIPEEGRTVIVVSSLLPAAPNAVKTAEHLFRLYNTNGQGAVQICLLADLAQAAYPTLPRDATDIAAMRREIRRLNKKTDNRFVFAVRPREYSQTMRAYTGRERKRGAIGQMIRVIKGEKPCYLAFEGDLEQLRRAKYLLALDADTGMLLDTASEIVGTALHPLVKAELSDDRRRVERGYGILTPRIGTELQSANRTAFSRAMAGIGGITPYDVPASDMYMDCFSAAIFTGKGLIDVEAFSALENNRFPAEQVLSHDILEGCLLRTGLISDVEMTDGFPASMRGWLDRLHRWIRGDWQNTPFLWNRLLPLTRLDQWKLIDNLRRSITPAVSLLCLLLSLLIPGLAGQVLALTGLLSPIAASLLAAGTSLIHGGWLTLGGKYYSRVLPRAMSALTQAFYALIMLPATAVTGADAAVRACIRLATRRHMLEWTTAAQADKHRDDWPAMIGRFWPSLLFAAVLLIWGAGFARLGGLLFAMLLPFAVYSAKTGNPEEANRVLTHAQKEQISSYAAAMWRYYEEQCTAEDHYLPPDNVQESPVWRVAHRTSPTNIGLYLLCIAAAHDFGLIDDEGMLDRIERTLTTIEKLEKWNGNLINWYDTRSLHPLVPRYVSTVDSGNFACCLVALRQALLEVGGARADALAGRAGKLQDEIDLTPMFNRNRSLFHIGLDPDTGEQSGSYYDLLMSESRMTGYYAIAMRMIPKKHWGTLGRTLTRSGNAVGPVSWTGTMFEYFMPRLLLPAEEGTMSYEAMRFCLHCQRRRPPRGIPWGISESGFYAFDSSLNYQYKAHGVPRLALKRGLGGELVISPYSSFLALSANPHAALKNLCRLERLGLTGSCGFYEAADFTHGRAARGGYSVVRSYMAHHVGMSLIACANASMDDVFVRRFLKDSDMERAMELSYEKAPTAGTVYEPARENAVPELPGRTRPLVEEIRTINPRTPRMHLLSGAEWQLAISDTGAGISSSREWDIHRYSADLLRAPQGIFVVVDGGEGAFSITAAPDFAETDAAVSGRKDVGPPKRRAEFETGAATFTAEMGYLEAGMRAMVHPRISCEQRQVVVKNHANHRVNATVLFYFEPSLARREDALAHPAFSRIFLSVHKDESAQALLVTRRQRLGEPPSCLAVGLLDGREFEYEPSREDLLRRPYGIASLADSVGRPFSSSGEGIPDCAVAIRIRMELPPHSQRMAAFVLTAGPDQTEATNRLIEVRREGLLSEEKSATSPFGGVEAELAAQVLPDLFYPPRMSKEWAAAARVNTKGQEALWALGISGDYPIILLEIHNAADASRAEPYMRLHRSLRLGGLITEMAIAYREGGEYDAPVLAALREAAKNASCESMIGARGGIQPVNLITHGEEALAFLTAVCAHNGARDLKRIGILPTEYRQMPIQSVEPLDDNTNSVENNPDTAVIPGGIFRKDSFIVTETPSLPWCHILANPTFGTMVSDKALGFTWAVNSRENKLTPWTNDTASDNRGEMLLLRIGGYTYDGISGSRAQFGDGYARYAGVCDSLRTTVTVRVPERGMWKTVELTLENTGEEEIEMQAAYYTDPVLGVDRSNARHTVAHWENGSLVLHNPFASIHGSMILTAVGGADGCDCDRSGFLSGSWGGGTLSPVPDPCAAVIVRRKLPPRRTESVTFVLGFASGADRERTKQAALKLPELSVKANYQTMKTPKIRTSDPLLDVFTNTWLPRQALCCRIYARTGFYQCGGAWGFRDQLQDSLAALWFKPEVTRRQLIRCAGAQFEEGDVLHWWYQLSRSLRGVRTHCSDDMAWLPYASAEYVDFTGDESLLDVEVRWLTGEVLKPEEKDRYFVPEYTEYKSSLYEHCLRAIERAVTHGEHGLPLIGSGDWNDGLSQVGVKGRGESVWLAMFLSIVLDRFAPICERRGDTEKAEAYRAFADEYRRAADACFATDRYLRAFFDDGTPLGSPGSSVCAVDSLPQSFSVLSGLPAEHANRALDTAFHLLVDTENGVLRLLAPSFEQTQAKSHVNSHKEGDEDASLCPAGYITAYPPGLRENGGQYTHAAVWLAIAFLEAGRAEEGVELLRLLNTAHKYADGLGDRYRGEPYALAGDVYSHPECPGRAGWTQYTGSAGWYYTAVLRHLLGFCPHGGKLELHPHIPKQWDGFEAELELNHTPVKIQVKRGEPSLITDGQPTPYVPLDGKAHSAVLTIANPT